MKDRIKKDISLEKKSKSPLPKWITQCKNLIKDLNFNEWLKTGKMENPKRTLGRDPDAKLDNGVNFVIRYAGMVYIEIGKTGNYAWRNNGELIIKNDLEELEQEIWGTLVGVVPDWDELREDWNNYLKNE